MNMLRRVEKFAPVEEAWKLLFGQMQGFPVAEEIETTKAIGRVLARPVLAKKSYPPFDTSHMDGYAVRARDVSAATPESPAKLPLVGISLPGGSATGELREGCTVRVLTGAAVPRGADAVIPQENVRLADGYVEVYGPVEVGESIDPKGSDIREGSAIFPPGHALRPQDVALLCYLGCWSIEVSRKPRAALLVVGDELTDDPDEVGRGKVFNTHAHIIQPLLLASGCESTYLGIVGDNPAEVESRLRKAVEAFDLVLTIGGSSVSEKDATFLALRSLGAGTLFQGLAVQPGRVGGFAYVSGKPVILLPGLVMSTVNVFFFLAYPLIRLMLGQSPAIYSSRVKAELAEDVSFRKFVDFKKVVWVSVEEKDGRLVCYPRAGSSSSMSTLARSHGFVVAAEGEKVIRAGTMVVVNLPPPT